MNRQWSQKTRITRIKAYECSKSIRAKQQYSATREKGKRKPPSLPKFKFMEGEHKGD